MSEPEGHQNAEPGSERFYRAWAAGRRLCPFEVTVGESDVQVFADQALPSDTEAAIRRVRRDIELYAVAHDGFLRTLRPMTPRPGAPAPVRRMCEATALYGVGPMAAVAGTVAECVGRELLRQSAQVIVENGGDIFFHTAEPPTFGLYAGKRSPFTGHVRFVPTGMTEGGVCTSSGTVGHSISFGRADAVVAVARDTALADAAATAIGNAVHTPDDVQACIDAEQERGLLDGLLIAVGQTLGAWGAIEIVEGV